MSRNEAVLAAALALPAEERAELMLRLVETLDEPVDEDAEEAWGTEIGARIAALRGGQADVLTVDEAMAFAREQLRTRCA